MFVIIALPPASAAENFHNETDRTADLYKTQETILIRAGIAQLVVLGLAAKVSRVRYSSGDIFR